MKMSDLYFEYKAGGLTDTPGKAQLLKVELLTVPIPGKLAGQMSMGVKVFCVGVNTVSGEIVVHDAETVKVFPNL
jgi:hypothetical protein